MPPLPGGTVEVVVHEDNIQPSDMAAIANPPARPQKAAQPSDSVDSADSSTSPRTATQPSNMADNTKSLMIPLSATQLSDMADSANSLARPQKVKHFNFLGLAAELRNRIYELLLCGRSEVKGTYPAIMRVSRQVYSETKNMLYIDNALVVKTSLFAFDDVFLGARREKYSLGKKYGRAPGHYEVDDTDSVDLDSDELESDRLENDHIKTDDFENDHWLDKENEPPIATEVHMLIEGDLEQSIEHATVERIASIWPARLGEIPEIDITISLEFDPLFYRDLDLITGDPGTDCRFEAVSWVLYSLISGMNNSVIPQKLIIQLIGNAVHQTSDLCLADIFYPICKIRNGIALVCSGFPVPLQLYINNMSSASDIDALPNVRAGIRLLDDFLAKPETVAREDNLPSWARTVHTHLRRKLTLDDAPMNFRYDSDVQGLVHLVIAILETKPWSPEQMSLNLWNARTNAWFRAILEGSGGMEGVEADITKL